MEGEDNQGLAAAELAAAEELEEKFNRVLALVPIVQSAETLEQIATLLDIALQTIAGNKKMLQRSIINVLNSEAFDEVAERAQLISSALDTLQDYLNRPLPEREGGNGQRDNLQQIPLPQVKREDRNRQVRKREEASESDPSTNTDDEDSDNDIFSDARSEVKPRRKKATKPTPNPILNSTSKSAATGTEPTTTIMSARFKEFKINGTVGEPGEKGKLTYGSLLHQVNSGIERKFEESEIIAAVIRCITPGNTTRIYLEGRRNLTVTKVMRTMKNHFGEGDVTSVYKQMTGAVQSTKQTAYQFISSMFAMRDRVMELSRQKKSTKRQYSRKLVQEDMQRGIYAGLRDPGIRQDLKHMLRQPNVDDDDLLDKLQLV